MEQIDWDKAADGLVPAVVQDADTRDVLMLGFMNRAALEKTLRHGKVTFWTRSQAEAVDQGRDQRQHAELCFPADQLQ